MMGAALATLFAYLVMALALYRTAQKVYFVPYDWPHIRTLALLVGGVYALERFFVLNHMVENPGGLLITRCLLFLSVVTAVTLNRRLLAPVGKF